MRLGHTLLRRMRALGVADAFDGDDMLSVQAHQGSQAGVDASMVNFIGRRVKLRYNDGASTAAAFTASTDTLG